MASESANTASDDEVNLLSDETKGERSDLVDGRVWRRLNSVVSSDSSGGPVLRTTVKPVKRFRPESNADKTTNPSPNRKKKLKILACCAGKSDEASVPTDGKKSFTGESGALILPDKPRASTPDTEKSASGSQISVEGNLPMKKKRVREQWSVEDKDFFFEAVAVYGKDFEAIRSSIAHKHRKKGQDSMAKTKNQVRHFYYRTWAMINKMIDADSYPLEINKAFQELYALINYGELRRKLGGNLKKRGLDKLNELIRHGTASLRVRGKNFRIKTPSCRALKKLSPENQGKEGILDFPLVSDTRRMKIPLHVNIDLYPLTMADWNRVHSYAHNPRLRLKVSVDTPLSSLLAYLDRKWKPQSERLLCFTSKNDWNETGNQSSSYGLSSCLVLQTPSDASVNTRIMVFQVSSNKAHAIVSYALRKATRTAEKSHRDIHEKNTDNLKESDIAVEETVGGAVSETEALDSCLSSEEDYDYDSANEEATGMSKCYQYGFGESVCKDTYSNMGDEFSPQTLNTNFTLKTKDSVAQNGSDSPTDSNSFSKKTMADITDSLVQYQTTATAGEDSVPDCATETSEEKASTKENGTLIEELSKAADSILGTEIDPDEETAQHRENTPDTPTLELSLVDDTDVNVIDGSSNDQDEISCLKPKETLEIDTFNSGGDCESHKNQDNESEMTDNNKFVTSKYCIKSKTRKKCRSMKNSDFIKAVQTWNMESCTNTTVAEVYMMLGKPSMFKLCYHWLHRTKEVDKNNDTCSCDDGKSQLVTSLSSGLSALLQAAGISKELRDCEISQTPDVKSLSGCFKNTKTASVQCELIKETPKVSNEVTLPIATSTSGNPHGRGLSKMVCAAPTPVAVVQPTSEFVVPTQRVIGRRKPTDNSSKNMMKISPQTMNFLLQRERLRNRLVRRPIVMDRSTQNRQLRTMTRPMKTFSIVTQGPKKVGFLPSTTVAVTLEESASKSPQLHNNSVLVDATGIPLSENNLLAQAAQEAGVFPCRNSSVTTSAGSINNFSTINASIQENFVVHDAGSTQVSDACGLSTESVASLPTNSTDIQQEVGLVASSSALQEHRSPDLVLVTTSENSTPLPTVGQFQNASSSNGASTMHIQNRQSEITELSVENVLGSDLTGQVDAAEGYLLMTPRKILPDGNVETAIADPLITTVFNATAPQLILPSDSEDSFDGILIRQRHQTMELQRLVGTRDDPVVTDERGISTRNGDPVSSSTDIALDLQLPTLINENSIDLMSKFQDLVRHTTEESGLTTLASDDNARDRPLGELTFDFQNSSGYENA